MKTKAAIKISDIPNFNPNNEYIVNRIKGDCLNSDQCTIKIKDGDLLLCHYVDRFKFRRNWQDYKDAVVLVRPLIPNSLHIDFAIVKQFVSLEHDWFVVMRMFNPPQNVELAIDEIQEMAIVDKVLPVDEIQDTAIVF